MPGFMLSMQGNLKSKKQTERPFFFFLVLFFFFFFSSKSITALAFNCLIHSTKSDNAVSQDSLPGPASDVLSALRPMTYFKCTSLHILCLYGLEEVEGKGIQKHSGSFFFSVSFVTFVDMFSHFSCSIF